MRILFPAANIPHVSFFHTLINVVSEKEFSTRTESLIRTIHGNDDFIVCCGSRGRAGDDGKILIYNTALLASDKAMQATEILCHGTLWVRSVFVINDRIISGGDDKTIKVWHAKSFECIQTLVGHTGSVYSVTSDGVKIYSASLDKTVKVWDMTTGNCITTLTDHTGVVGEVHVIGFRLISSASDGVKIWDTRSYECLHSFNELTFANVCANEQLIFIGRFHEGNLNIKVWDINSYDLMHTLVVESGYPHEMSIVCDILFCRSIEGVVRAYNIHTYERICITNKLQSCGYVMCMYVTDSFLISSLIRMPSQQHHISVRTYMTAKKILAAITAMSSYNVPTEIVHAIFMFLQINTYH